VHVDFGDLGIWAVWPMGVRKVEGDSAAAGSPPTAAEER
jgi:hypothetical protein